LGPRGAETSSGGLHQHRALGPGTIRTTRTELDYELTHAEAGRHLIVTGHNKTVTTTDNVTLEADGPSSSITYDATFVFHGVAARVAPMFRSSLETLADRTVDQMKDVLDGPKAAGAR